MKFRIIKHKIVNSDGYYYTVQKKGLLFWNTPYYFNADWSDNPKRFMSIEEVKVSIEEYFKKQQNLLTKPEVVETIMYPLL